MSADPDRDEDKKNNRLKRLEDKKEENEIRIRKKAKKMKEEAAV